MEACREETSDFPEPDFWPGIVSEYAAIRRPFRNVGVSHSHTALLPESESHLREHSPSAPGDCLCGLPCRLRFSSFRRRPSLRNGFVALRLLGRIVSAYAVTCSESDFCLFSWSELSALPRWRTERAGGLCFPLRRATRVRYIPRDVEFSRPWRRREQRGEGEIGGERERLTQFPFP
jgi:hypothetical protein